jgi:hypothetical protein
MPEEAVTVTAPAPGPVSTWLSAQGFDHDLLPADHLGVEVLGIEPAASRSRRGRVRRVDKRARGRGATAQRVQ